MFYLKKIKKKSFTYANDHIKTGSGHKKSLENGLSSWIVLGQPWSHEVKHTQWL